MHHPHLHCVVSGGGLARDESRWIASRGYYFLPVKLLSHVYRRKFRTLLQKAFLHGELEFYGDLLALAEAKVFQSFLDAATKRAWVVYAKRPFGGPEQVLKYLARYTHRVAISNSRLLAYRDGQVTFRYKDYARESRQRTMTLDAGDFIRRFLLHVLPDGFMRIRHYGYLANRHRREKLEICRRLLGAVAPATPPTDAEPPRDEPCQPSPETAASFPCPVCQTGQLQITDTWHRQPRRCLAFSTISLPRATSSIQDSS